MLKKTFFIALVIMLIVVYNQLFSSNGTIKQTLPIVIFHAKTSQTEAEEVFSTLFNQCDIKFQSMLMSEMDVEFSGFYIKTNYRPAHLLKPVYQSIESFIKAFDHAQKVSGDIYYLIEKPTLKDLKQLRLHIEHNFNGSERASVFDSVIPILSISTLPSSSQCEFIEDYVIYTTHNFGGTGFLV